MTIIISADRFGWRDAGTILDAEQHLKPALAVTLASYHHHHVIHRQLLFSEALRQHLVTGSVPSCHLAHPIQERLPVMNSTPPPRFMLDDCHTCETPRVSQTVSEGLGGHARCGTASARCRRRVRRRWLGLYHVVDPAIIAV